MPATKPEMALVTIPQLGSNPDLTAAARQLGVQAEDLDADFGLVPVDVVAGLYCAKVTVDRLPPAFELRVPFQGPFADPTVLPMGPTPGGQMTRKS